MWISSTKNEAEFKKDVRDRIIKARADGVTTGKIVKASGEMVTFGAIYDIISANYVKMEMWRRVDQCLKKMGY